jgi:hypothetical protein
VDDLEKHLSELTDAARRAGSVVNTRVDEIVVAAERQAETIRRSAESDAQETRRNAERDAEEIRRRAAREAEQSRREALASADRVFERINSLERPLADLVGTLRFEADKVGREIEGHVDVEATAISVEAESLSPDSSEVDGTTDVRSAADPIPDVEEATPQVADPSPAPVEDLSDQKPVEEPVAEASPKRPKAVKGERSKTRKQPVNTPAPAAAEEPRTTEPDERAVNSREPAPTATAAPAEARAAPTTQPPPFTVSPPPGEEKREGFFSKLRPGGSKRPFINTPGNCAVCQKTFEAGSEEALAQSGWKVSGDVGLCPEDQADGWQLPEGARLPFRRGGG